MDYSTVTWKDPIFRQVNNSISYQPNVLKIERVGYQPGKALFKLCVLLLVL